jgi:hypothetical protein
MLKLIRWSCLISLGLMGCESSDPKPSSPTATTEKSVKPKKIPPLTRIFVQDLKSTSLQWADLRVSDQGEWSLDPLVPLEGFPKLDPEKQKLVQMKESGEHLCIGIRDDEEGAFQSGWAMINSGIRYVDHGDHGHWSFRLKPEVSDLRLDAKQGNPAHLYLYDGRFFLANDRLNAYTRIDPAKYGSESKDQPRLLHGGGNHITLAVVDDRVGYSCWIDGGGPNKGRVDVTPLPGNPLGAIKYSFTLPSGGIHGAIANSGKVFFAPSEGVCWVEADREAKWKPEQVKVHHLALGKEGDSRRRTGAFINYKNYVLFTTGKEAESALMLLDAKEKEPKPIAVPLSVKKGSQAVTPTLAVTPEGKAYAFLFHDHAKDVDVEDRLEIIDLDPNGDGNCADAKVIKNLKVGKSLVEGHYGHHDITFDAGVRYGFFTNPGDGNLSVLSLKTLEVVHTFPLKGIPTAIAAFGGLETED